MSKLKTILVLMLAIVGIGCAGSPLKETNIGEADTEEYQIQQVLDTFVEAYQNHNLELLKSTLWEESSYYSQIVGNAKSDFARFPTINLTFTDIRISFYSDGKRAGVILQESFQAENETKKHRQETVLIEMIKTEDEWQIVSFYWPAMMRDIPESERKKECGMMSRIK